MIGHGWTRMNTDQIMLYLCESVSIRGPKFYFKAQYPLPLLTQFCWIK